MERMLFGLILVFMILTAIDSALTRIRIHDLEKRLNANMQEPIKTPHKAKIKPTEETDEQRKYRILMENIENFGTKKEQKEVR